MIQTDKINSTLKPLIQHSGGGRVENTNPLPGTWLVNRSNSRPQIRVFILPDKDSIIYGRIKLPARQRDWDTRILESINFLRPPAL
jgi:hypothetical protein